MAKPRPGKKAKTKAVQPQLPGMPVPAPPGTIRLFPAQLQIGDRLSDETGEWEVVGAAVHNSVRKERARATPKGQPSRCDRHTDVGSV
jgi:hypothetical protein